MEAAPEVTVLADSERAPPAMAPPAIPERLQQRDAERREEAERRRRAREALTVQEEQSDYFSAAFARERETIERLLLLLEPEAEPGPGLQEEAAAAAAAVSEAAGRLQELQRLLTDAVRFLAPYEVRQAQATLTRLQDALSERRQQLQPKKRFAFKKGLRKEPGQPAAAAAPAQPSEPRGEEDCGRQGPRAEASPAACGFSQLEDQEVSLGAAELLQQDVVLSELRRCRVRLQGNPNTLAVRGCRDCTVLCGPVSTSVMVDDCRGCLLALACQQLRTHRTSRSSFYVQVTSRAILEDCSGVRFAPYTWRYEGIDADFETSGLDRSRDNWNQVDDFNWLARDQPSPNWSLIPEKERVTNWD